ncbi:MAG TPA: cupredoxin domain-containing protein [Actinomycetota bacterium]|nr:cupredoxin domain-containing protein [Actinomycetota bacterium]
MSTQDDSLRPDLTTEVRVKVPLPLVIPLVSLAVIGLVAYGFAQVLLAVPKEAATMLAMVAAANVMGAFAYAALRPRMQPVTMAELGVIVLYPVIIGIAIAQFGFGAEAHGHDTAAGETHGAGAAGEGAAPSGPTTAVVATGLVFDVETLVLEAKKDTSIEFTNEDSAPHNIAIYEDDSASGEAIFEGEQISASSTTYEFKAPPAGEYYFQCDVHPDMNGEVLSE